MLSIGAKLPPEHRTGRVVNRLALTGNRFAVGLHLKLFKIGSEILQPTVVGQNGVRTDIQKIDVPDARQAKQYG